MQLLVKGTRRIIFILCAVSDAKRYYSNFEKIIYVFLTIFLYLLKCP